MPPKTGQDSHEAQNNKTLSYNYFRKQGLIAVSSDAMKQSVSKTNDIAFNKK